MYHVYFPLKDNYFVLTPVFICYSSYNYLSLIVSIIMNNSSGSPIPFVLSAALLSTAVQS